MRVYLKGFVNKNTKYFFTGEKKSLTEEIEEWLDKFGNKKEEDIFEMIIIENIISCNIPVDNCPE